MVLKFIFYMLLTIYLVMIAYAFYFYKNLKTIVKNCYLGDDITIYSLIVDGLGQEDADALLNEDKVPLTGILLPIVNILPIIMVYLFKYVPEDHTDELVDLIRLKIKQAKEEYELKEKFTNK